MGDPFRPFRQQKAMKRFTLYIAAALLGAMATDARAQLHGSFSVMRSSVTAEQLRAELASDSFRRILLFHAGADIRKDWELHIESDGDLEAGWAFDVSFNGEIDTNVRRKVFDQIIRYIRLRAEGHSQITSIHEAIGVQTSDELLAQALAKTFRTISVHHIFPWVCASGRIEYVMVDGGYGWIFRVETSVSDGPMLMITKVDEKQLDFRFSDVIRQAEEAARQKGAQRDVRDRLGLWNDMKELLAAQGIDWSTPDELNKVAPVIDF